MECRLSFVWDKQHTTTFIAGLPRDVWMLIAQQLSGVDLLRLLTAHPLFYDLGRRSAALRDKVTPYGFFERSLSTIEADGLYIETMQQGMQTAHGGNYAKKGKKENEENKEEEEEEISVSKLSKVATGVLAFPSPARKLGEWRATSFRIDSDLRSNAVQFSYLNICAMSGGVRGYRTPSYFWNFFSDGDIFGCSLSREARSANAWKMGDILTVRVTIVQGLPTGMKCKCPKETERDLRGCVAYLSKEDIAADLNFSFDFYVNYRRVLANVRVPRNELEDNALAVWFGCRFTESRDRVTIVPCDIKRMREADEETKK